MRKLFNVTVILTQEKVKYFNKYRNIFEALNKTTKPKLEHLHTYT